MLAVVILAAGRGSRMQSNNPKVMHTLAGKPLLYHVYEAAIKLQPKQFFIVYKDNLELLKSGLPQDNSITWVEQEELLGTASAVNCAIPFLTANQVLILNGDLPLISSETLNNLAENTSAKTWGLLSCNVAKPDGYGRIVRNTRGQVTAIVEHKDCTKEQLSITEVNVGAYIAPVQSLKKKIVNCDSDNKQGEYYLTDVIKMAVDSGESLATCEPQSTFEAFGVNTKAELLRLERLYQLAQAESLLSCGVQVLDKTRLDIRGEVKAGIDCLLDVNVIIEGSVTLGDNVVVGPNVLLKNSTLGNNVRIEANSCIDGASIGDGATVGPFARIRPGTVLGEKAKIGNFVETKQVDFGAFSKASHLSYIGNATVGCHVNIGAGTITCNYDGLNKHHTNIGNNAFIGSGSKLVAPINVGESATIGAGTTLLKDAPKYQLTVNSISQKVVANWCRHQQEKLNEE